MKQGSIAGRSIERTDRVHRKGTSKDGVVSGEMSFCVASKLYSRVTHTFHCGQDNNESAFPQLLWNLFCQWSRHEAKIRLQALILRLHGNRTENMMTTLTTVPEMDDYDAKIDEACHNSGFMPQAFWGTQRVLSCITSQQCEVILIAEHDVPGRMETVLAEVFHYARNYYPSWSMQDAGRLPRFGALRSSLPYHIPHIFSCKQFRSSQYFR